MLNPKIIPNFAPQNPNKGMQDSVAQLVEQLTLNQWVEGSSPSGVTQAGNLSISGFLFWAGRTLVRRTMLRYCFFYTTLVVV